ncbi:hypothetical protein Tco_0798615 [Tanacetum coccineum]
MFKVFNRCLTSRLSGHDQTKINILQILHAYPRFTKLIIADLMEKYESIPKRLEEYYHTIKDDTSLAKYGGVEVPMIQPEPVESTHGTHRTPNPANVQTRKRKGKQVAGESSSPKPSLNIRIKQQKSTSTTPLPPSDDEERDDIIEVTQLSLALDKTAKVYEEQRNMAAVEQNTLEEDVEKIVEGEEEYDGTEFADMVLLSDEDSGGRLEPESHKENPEKNDDDEKKDDNKDDDDDHDDHALIKT